ncbi:hypothetical protein AU193_20400 [Mycobacterium sp. GA-1285]|nr:hypothetical protein AU193_20400 [Mycobacterium sp. GA-1285]
MDAAAPEKPVKRLAEDARKLGLPSDSDEFAAGAPAGCAMLCSALVKVSLDDELRETVSARG